MQDLFEPQLVHLVHHDEQGLVVLGPLGERLLEREKLVELEVARIGERHASSCSRKRLRETRY
jgi:hypothetical protein